MWDYSFEWCYTVPIQCKKFVLYVCLNCKIVSNKLLILTLPFPTYMFENFFIVQVSDVNDDVRRAAVTCLGFVLFR